MNTESLLNTEEDLKVKVVSEWLRGHGFGARDISLEKTFELRFGRSTLVIGPPNNRTLRHARCDYLVKAHDGRNLMIVEVKAQGETLDDDVKEQGISYARALRIGGIAPFTVLTNGTQTLIYDSVTEELLNGTQIPIENKHARNGFRYSGEDIALRAEALKVLVSLSPENLLAFCRHSVDHHLRLLRSNDLKSGKKYIPPLYVPRSSVSRKLTETLERVDRSVTLVVGLPQVGKTNVLCKFTEDALLRGLPCLFYPAVSLRKGLLEELSDDFQWTFGEERSLSAMAQKLSTLLTRTHQRLLIVVDGWNEAECDIARALNDECQRLATCEIHFVLSMTNLAARRLLTDKANNTAFIADTVGISHDTIPLLEIDPAKVPSDANVVVVEQYSEEESDRAYETYAKEYSVRVPEGAYRTSDPFLLGIAMPLFAGADLPLFLDEPSIIERHLARKADHVANLPSTSVRAILRTLGEEMFQNDVPTSENALLMRCRMAASDSFDSRLFEAALLTRCEERGFRTIDFYYARERDFVIAEWVRNWPKSMETYDSLFQEIGLAVRTNAGTEALRWFFSQRSYIQQLRVACERIQEFQNEGIRRLLLSAIMKVFRADELHNEWIRGCMDKSLQDASNLVRLEAIKLMALITDDDQVLADQLSADSNLVAGLLTIDHDYPLSKGSAGQIVLDALTVLHARESQDGESSPLSDILAHFVDGEVMNLRRAASRALAYVSPRVFFETVSLHIRQGVATGTAEDLLVGVEPATSQLGEYYYGSYCPGALKALKEDSALGDEYREMVKLLGPTIRFFGRGRCQGLLDILDDLRPADVAEGIEDLAPTFHSDQPDLPFPADAYHKRQRER